MKKIVLRCGTVLTLMTLTGGLLAQEINGAGQSDRPNSAAESLTAGPIAEPETIWTADGVGEGFRPHLQEFGISEGAGWVTHDIGGKKSHNLLLTRLYYGHMLGDRVGAGKWYGGNFEFIQEVLGAWQYYPAATADRYVTGFTSMLRYNLATGTRLVPFLDAGLGASLTDIGNPDLGSPGEFNLQIGPGFDYFLCNSVALTMQYRYMHMSNAGIKSPNQGINENIAYVGVSWFF